MMAAQRDAVARVQRETREQNRRQYVVGLKALLATATSARSVPFPHCPGPFFARLAVPERLPGTAVDVIGVVRAGMQSREALGLGLTTLARLRASRAVPVPVLARRAKPTAHHARALLGPRVRQRTVDVVEDAFVTADHSDIPSEVVAGLEMGAKSTAGLGRHLRVQPRARLTAELALWGVPAAPSAVSLDHVTTLQEDEALV